MAITVFDVAKALGAVEDSNGCISGEEFRRLGLPILGGCARCGASIAAYNACPTRTGYLMCAGDEEDGVAGCTGQLGFATVEEYFAFEEAEKEAQREGEEEDARTEADANREEREKEAIQCTLVALLGLVKLQHEHWGDLRRFADIELSFSSGAEELLRKLVREFREIEEI